MTQQTATPIPAWLQALNPDPSLDLDPPTVSPLELARLRKQDMMDTFEAIFDQAVDAVENGEGISLFLSRDHRSITPGRFMRWILADPTRERRYKDACRVAAHLMRGDILAKADGTDQTIDDVARSKLAVDARFKLMALADPKEFITTTKVDVTSTSISITAALEKANNRLQRITPITTSSPSTLIEEAVVKTLPQPDPSPDDSDGGEED